MLDTGGHVWTLREGGANSRGLSCTDDGIFLGRTPLLERQNGRLVARAQSDLERLISSGFGIDAALDRVMPGLNAVASALKAGDQCRARIAAVHLRIPELPDVFARLEMETEDLLIKLEQRAEVFARGDWDPAKHPREGTAPNPGWFAPTGDATSEAELPLSTPQDDSNAPSSEDAPVRLPPGERIDELGDLLEWIANAKPEDEQTIRSEIKRYYYDVGDVQGGNMLNMALTDALEPGLTRHDREELLAEFEPYTRADPAEVAQFGRDLTTGILLSPPGAEIAVSLQIEKSVWEYGWSTRGFEIHERLGGNLPWWFKGIDDFDYAKGIATSFKSIDIRGVTYQDTQRLFGRITREIDNLARFDGAEYEGFAVDESAIKGRTLRVVIPTGVNVTDAQQSAIHAASDYAKSRGIELQITPF